MALVLGNIGSTEALIGRILEQYCVQKQESRLSDEEDTNYSNFIPIDLIRNYFILLYFMMKNSIEVSCGSLHP